MNICGHNTAAESDHHHTGMPGMMGSRNGRCLILFPIPFQGHTGPMLQLAQILHSRGFSITVVHTTINPPDPSAHPHFVFRSIQDGISQSEASSSDVLTLLKLINTRCVVPFEECLRELVSNSSDGPVACLISDSLLLFAGDVAERVNVHRVVLRTGGATSLRVFAGFPLLLERGHLPIQDSRSEDPVAVFPPLQVKDLPVIETQEREVFYQMVNGMIEGIKTSSGVILNTFEDLEQDALSLLRREFPVPIFPIGPFHKWCASSSASLFAEDNTCISWLDNQAPKSVIYVSFGSLAGVTEAEFSQIAFGLADSEQPFLWAVRPGSVRGSDSKWLDKWRSGFLEALGGRGKIVGWAPQKQVLAHPAVGAFWTHNGWNSTVESVCQGVPMICMPCFTDQSVNARFVSDVWRLGTHLNGGLERGKIAEAIKTLMVEREGEEIRERVSNLKEKAQLCLRPEGSSFASLNWLVDHILRFEQFVFCSEESPPA